MGFPTYGDIVDDTIVMMGQVSGSSVQTYTEPLVKLAVNRIFTFLYNKMQWDHLWTWETKTLDGTTGKFTTVFTTVKQWEDVTEMRIGGTERVIPKPVGNEHTIFTSGSTPEFYTVLPWDDADAETKFIQIWPPTATGSVDMLVGHRPENFELPDDKVPMDRSLMVDGAVWWLLEDDGMNPASVDKARTAFDLNYQDIISRAGAKPIGHGRGAQRGSRTVLIQS